MPRKTRIASAKIPRRAKSRFHPTLATWLICLLTACGVQKQVPSVPHERAGVAASQGTRAPSETVTEPGQRLFDGYTRHEINCYLCHDGNATGARRAPNLRDAAAHESDEELRQTILDGNDEMPSFRGRLSDVEVAEILAWLRLPLSPTR